MPRLAFILGYMLLLFTHLNAKEAGGVIQLVQLNTPEGKPANLVEYHLYKANYYSPEQNRVVSGKTNEKGQFSFQKTPTEKYKNDRYILITHSDEWGYNFYNKQVWKDELAIFELKKNQEELKLRFLDAEGNPVSKISFSLKKMTLLKSNPRNYYDGFFDIPAIDAPEFTIVSDELGIVRFRGLPSSSAVYLDHEDDRYAKLEGRLNFKYQIQPSTSIIDVPLLAAAQISGRVVDLVGKPVQGVKIRCLTDRYPRYDGCGDDTVSDENGAYTLKQLRPNSYGVMANLSDELARECAAPLLRAKLTLGQSLKGFDIQFQQGGTLKGYLKDAKSGVAIANESKSMWSLLSLIPSGENYGGLSLGSLSIPVSEKGYFEIKVPEGRYSLHFGGLLDGYDRDSIKSFKFESKDESVIEHDLLIQPLQEEHYVTGVVVDLDGKPVEGASVRGGSRSSAHSFPLATTDRDGKFKIYVNASEHKNGLFLCAIKDGQISKMKKVTRGNTYTIKINPKEMAGLYGRVVDGGGEPVGGVEVEYGNGYYFGNHEEPVIPKIITSEDGVFRFSSVWPHERSHVALKKEGYSSRWERLEELKPGVKMDLGDVVLKTEGNLTVIGQVLDKNGEPLQSIVFSYGENQPDYYQRTREDGRFEIKNVSKGDIYIGAKDMKYKSYRKIAGKWVKAGASNVVLKSRLGAPSKTVRGRVLDENGKPAPGVWVATYMSDQPKLNTQTDRHGYFILKGVYSDWLDLHIKHSLNDEDPTEVRTKPGLENEVFRMKGKSNEDKFETLPKGFSWIGKVAPKVEVDRWMNTEGYPELNKGKVRIIDFWNIQCGPCVANLPKMEKFWQKNKGRKLEMISLHSSIREGEFKEFLKNQRKHKKEFSMPFGFERDDHPVRCAFQPQAAPTYCVIDASGVVQYFDSGDWPEAQKKALELLNALESSTK